MFKLKPLLKWLQEDINQTDNSSAEEEEHPNMFDAL